MSSWAPPQQSADLVVLGGGPAGLAAAWRAARRGLRVVLLERAPHVGGMAAGFEIAGVRVDLGSHRLHPATDPDLLADLRGLLGDDLQTRPRHGRLRVADRWLDFPLRAGQLVTDLPRDLVTGAARDAVLAPLRPRRGTSYESVLRSGLGPTLYDAMYGPYARKLWGLPGSAIDAEQARRRVGADTPWKVAARVLRGGRTSAGTQQGAVFLYPRRGFGQIVDVLEAAAVDCGADVLNGVEVTAVHARPDGVRVLWEGGAIQARHVFSTLPLTTLGRLARPAPSAQAVQDAAALHFRAMVLVYLVHEGGRWTEYDAHYLPDSGTRVTRISEPANYRESSDDPADRTVLCAEIPCEAGGLTWSMTDDELAGLVLDGIEAAGLPAVCSPASGAVHVRRLRHVYPVYGVGYTERLAGIAGWAERLPGVTTFGRLGMFVHDNTHHAMRMAYDAVDSLRDDGSLDAGAWAAARERFRTHVVED